ncbi:MAG: GNAT family N-acetyltransferase [Pseudomonadales bacterium]
MDLPIIRRERADDFELIREVTKLAFADMRFADGDEHELTDAHAPGWYALGPVSVHPAHQRSGVGSALIEQGLEELETMGVSGCILTGDPRFYARFGFNLAPSLTPPGEPPEYFMVKLICGQGPTRPISFHRAFHDDA